MFPAHLPAKIIGVAAVMALCAGLVMTERSEPQQRFIASEHPSAVLAWAKLRCDPGLVLRADAPRAQAEDVLAVAAAYETDARYRHVSDVCADALAAARAVTSPQREAPGSAADSHDLVAVR